MSTNGFRQLNYEFLKELFALDNSTTVNSEFFARVYFREPSHMRKFVKIKSLLNGEITLLFTDIASLCHSREFLMPQICLLTLFAKIKFLRKFADLH